VNFKIHGWERLALGRAAGGVFWNFPFVFILNSLNNRDGNELQIFSL